MKVTVKPLKRNPQVVDEVHDEDYTIHIECLTEHVYWMRIGEENFYFVNPSGKGAGIQLITAEEWNKR